MFAHFRNIETTDFMSQGKEDNSYIGNPSIVDNVPQKKREGGKEGHYYYASDLLGRSWLIRY